MPKKNEEKLIVEFMVNARDARPSFGTNRAKTPNYDVSAARKPIPDRTYELIAKQTSNTEFKSNGKLDEWFDGDCE